MDIENWKRKTFKGFHTITNVMVWIGTIALAGIVLTVTADVCGRYFLNKPLVFSYELIEQTMGILGAIAIMYAVLKRGHIALDLIPPRLPKRIQMIMQSIFSFLGSLTSFVFAYEIWLTTLSNLNMGTKINNTDMVIAPFTFLIAIALSVCGLTLLIHTFNAVAPDETNELKE